MIRKIIILISKIKLWQTFVFYSLISISLWILILLEAKPLIDPSRSLIRIFGLGVLLLIGFPSIITVLIKYVGVDDESTFTQKNIQNKKQSLKENFIELICGIKLWHEMAFYCPISALLVVLNLCKVSEILANSSEEVFFVIFFILLFLFMSPIFAINIIQDIHFNDGNA